LSKIIAELVYKIIAWFKFDSYTNKLHQN